MVAFSEAVLPSARQHEVHLDVLVAEDQVLPRGVDELDVAVRDISERERKWAIGICLVEVESDHVQTHVLVALGLVHGLLGHREALALAVLEHQPRHLEVDHVEGEVEHLWALVVDAELYGGVPVHADLGREVGGGGEK